MTGSQTKDERAGELIVIICLGISLLMLSYELGEVVVGLAALAAGW